MHKGVIMNRHIKVINGRKYYYSSIRRGKKVTSKYIGPVERIRSMRRKAVEEETVQQEYTPETHEEDNYIG